MKFDVQYDDGKPVYVCTDDGFIQTGRAFNEKTDGWMLEQLDPRDFPAIRAGRDMENLVHEVNALRREVFSLKQSNKDWMGAAGFGRPRIES